MVVMMMNDIPDLESPKCPARINVLNNSMIPIEMFWAMEII